MLAMPNRPALLRHPLAAAIAAAVLPSPPASLVLTPSPPSPLNPRRRRRSPKPRHRSPPRFAARAPTPSTWPPPAPGCRPRSRPRCAGPTCRSPPRASTWSRSARRRPRVSWNAETPMNPASTMKVVTTFAGLQLLGPDYRWLTSLYADSEPAADGTIRGNVYLRGPRRSQTGARGDGQAGGLGAPRGRHHHRWRRGARPQLLRGCLRRHLPDRRRVPARLQRQSGRAAVRLQDPLFHDHPGRRRPHRGRGGHARAGAIARGEPPDTDQRPLRRLALARTPNITPQPDGTVVASFDGIYSSDCGEHVVNLATLSRSDFIWGGFVAEWQAAGGRFAHTPGAAQRRGAAWRLPALAPLRPAARRRGARHQQVLEQRDGAPAVPDDRRGDGHAAARPARRVPRR